MGRYRPSARSSIPCCAGAGCWRCRCSHTARSKRDRTALFLLVGYLAQVLPWVFISRLTFEYHYFAATLFLVLALGYVFDRLRQRGYLGIVYAFTAANGVLFALFFPVLTGVTIPRELCMECAQMAPGLAVLTPGKFQKSRYCL